MNTEETGVQEEKRVCPECGQQIVGEQTTCQCCGYNLQQEKEKKVQHHGNILHKVKHHKAILGSICLIVVLLICGAVYWKSRIPLEAITLSSRAETLLVGEKKQLKAHLFPLKTTDRNVQWTSSDNEVATVDKDGNIEAVAKGKCEITATEKHVTSSKCKITVGSEVEAVELETHEGTLTEGHEGTILYTITPSDAVNRDGVKWYSSDESVCSVDEEDGDLYGASAGTATITVTTANGKADSCEITVEEERIKKENCSLDDFINRYNEMTKDLYRNTGVYVDYISRSTLKDNAIRSGAGGTILFTGSEDNKYSFEDEIDAFMWVKEDWKEMDAQELLGDFFCTVAGYIPGSTYNSVKDVIFPLFDNLGDGMYGSIEINNQTFIIGRTTDEVIFSGSNTEE